MLFEDEWRNFEISYNGLGRITLSEVFTGKTLINYTDPQSLNLLYALPRSKSPALWKVHKSISLSIRSDRQSNKHFSDQFLSTEEEGISKLGREIETPSSVLCVSLYVALCENCSMTFSIKEEGETNDVEKIIGNKVKLYGKNGQICYFLLLVRFKMEIRKTDYGKYHLRFSGFVRTNNKT